MKHMRSQSRHSRARHESARRRSQQTSLVRRSPVRWLLIGLLLVASATYALAEELTLTTYYPSPRGVYDQLRTAGDVGIGEVNSPPIARLYVLRDTTGSTDAFRVDDDDPFGGDLTPFLIDDLGNVGIGTSSPDPAAKLDVDGQIRIRGGDPEDGRVLTSDANGVGTWEPLASLTGCSWEPPACGARICPAGKIMAGVQPACLGNPFCEPCGGAGNDSDLEAFSVYCCDL